MKLTDDFRQAFLSIFRRPGFLLPAITTLSIGIASTLTIFSIVDHVMLRPWPFPEPDRLVVIDRFDREKDQRAEIHSYPDFVDLREQMKGLDGLTAYTGTGFFLDGNQGSELLLGFRVSADFVSTLGVRLAAGRGFESTDVSGDANVVIISSRLADALFGNPTDAVGSRLRLSDESLTIIGVVAEPLLLARASERDLLVPLVPEPGRVEQRRSHWLRLIGRRSEGVSLRQLQSELDAVAAALGERFPRSNADRLFPAAPLTDRILGPAAAALYILLAAVALLLVVACANVANLLVVRAVGRQREVAMRMVMGAGRTRLLRQLFAENVLLALIAAVVAILLVKFTLGTILELLPAGIPLADRVALDTRLVVFSIGLALLTTVVFGTLPALQATRSDLFTALRQGHGESRGQSRLRNLLVVNEIALSLVLVSGAFLLIQSFWQLTHTDPGFRSQGVLTASFINREMSPEESRQGLQHLLERIEARPDIETAGVVDFLPLEFGWSNTTKTRGGWVEGPPPQDPEGELKLELRAASAGYLRALSIPLLEGRLFDETDSAEAPGVVLISESLARSLWPDGRAAGKKLTIPGGTTASSTVVGVVGDVRHFGLDEPPVPTLYRSYLQAGSPATLVARTSGDPLKLAPFVRAQILSFNPRAAILSTTTAQEVVSATIQQPLFLMSLLTMLAAITSILSLVGVYGVISFAVRQRVSELGIRQALGATRRDIFRLVIHRGASLTAAGVVVGVAATLLLSRYLESQLYSVSPADPTTLVLSVGVLAAGALIISAIPAFRATRLDPLEALRSD